MNIIEIDLSQVMPIIRHCALVNVVAVDFPNNYTQWRVIYDYEIIYVTKGEIIVEEKEKTYVVKKGQLHIMPPMVWHKRTVKEDFQYYNIHFDFKSTTDNLNIDVVRDYIAPIAERGKIPVNSRLSMRTSYKLKGIEIPRIINMGTHPSCEFFLSEMNKSFIKNTAISSFYMKGLFESFLGCVLDVLNKPNLINLESCINEFKKEVISYGDVDVKKFCENIGYSYDYFRKQFSQREGISIQKYILMQKLEKAKQLLLDKTLSIKDVAEMSGFVDMYYFSTSFKKYTGYSPNKFRTELYMSLPDIEDKS